MRVEANYHGLHDDPVEQDRSNGAAAEEQDEGRELSNESGFLAVCTKPPEDGRDDNGEDTAGMGILWGYTGIDIGPGLVRCCFSTFSWVCFS